jgi:hypothetical protein
MRPLSPPVFSGALLGKGRPRSALVPAFNPKQVHGPAADHDYMEVGNHRSVGSGRLFGVEELTMKQKSAASFSRSPAIRVLSVASVIAAVWAASASPASAGGFLQGIVDSTVKAVQDTGHAIETGTHDVGNTGQKAVQDAGHAIETGAHDAGNTGQKAVQDAGHAIETGAHDVGNTGQTAVQDAGHTIETGAHDTGKAVEKGVQDVGTAGQTIGRFVERQIKGVGETLSDADKRIREGKVVDAIWHMGTDPLKHTEEKNAAKAAQESNILRTVGQVAATAYGGPGGAAAYAAWYAYRATGDADLALRVALITGPQARASARPDSSPPTLPHRLPRRRS